MSLMPRRGLAYAALLCGLALLIPVGIPGLAQAAAAAHDRVQSPPPAPVIASTGPNVYVSGSAKNLIGTPGQFTFSDAAGSAVVKYLYGFGNPSPDIPVLASSSGTASLGVTPYNGSEFDLYVTAENKSGQVSPPSEFQIETVSPPGNVASLAWWKLNAGHGVRADDATGHGHTAKLGGAAALRCGSAAPDAYRCWLSLAGSNSQAATSQTVLPLVGNDGSYTVSAWVRAAACSATCVALSEDASMASGFALAYRRSCTAGSQAGPCWLFDMPAEDSKSAVIDQAVSLPGSAHAGKWTQLTGVYNASHGALTLYVNGVQAGQYVGAPPWSAPAAGPVRLGGVPSGAAGVSWTGQLSNVCIFYGVMQSADVKLLYSGNAAHPHNGCAALQAKYP